METSINTSISPSIPFSRRVINDIEEHQRRVLDDSVEGTNRGTNTSPTPNPGKQEEEVIIPNTGLQVGITPAETQEETLQPESLKTQDTDIKQVNPMQDQDSKSLQAQNIIGWLLPVFSLHFTVFTKFVFIQYIRISFYKKIV